MKNTQRAVLDIDDSGSIHFASPLAAGLLGFDYHDMLGHDVHALIHHSHPDGSPFLEEHCQISRAMKFGHALVTPFEVFWRRDGVALPVRYALTRLEAGDIVLSFTDLTGEIASDELDIRIGVPEIRSRSMLTARERVILDGLVAGQTNRQIGEDLFLATKTIRNLLCAIYLKLDVDGRSEAAVLWERVSVKDALC